MVSTPSIARCTPPRALPAPLKTLYTNLGPTPTNYYNDTTGYYVLGPNNSVALGEQWIAFPFTMKVNARAEVLRVAVGWISGTKKIQVGLYADSSGNLGTLLALDSATNIPAFGSCCHLVSVTIPPTALTAGTQYWVGVTTDDTAAPDFTGVFQSSNLEDTAFNPAQGGWITFSNLNPAGAVFGTIP